MHKIVETERKRISIQLNRIMPKNKIAPLKLHCGLTINCTRPHGSQHIGPYVTIFPISIDRIKKPIRATYETQSYKQ